MNPDWKDSEVPVFVSTRNRAERLATSFLCLQVVDHDLVGKNDVMGRCAVLLCCIGLDFGCAVPLTSVCLWCGAVDGVLFLAEAVTAGEQGKSAPFKVAVSHGMSPTLPFC